MKQKINHPMADTISIIRPPMTSRKDKTYHNELAFFSDGQWVVSPIPELKEYHDGATVLHSESSVYTWVPNDVLANFLNEYGVRG